MHDSINTLALAGLEGKVIKVTAKLYNGLNRFSIVGLPDRSIIEAKERLTSALLSSRLKFPYGQLFVNLAPAYEAKSGTHFDLPICVAVLLTTELNSVNLNLDLAKTLIIGEVGLQGEILGVKSAAALVVAARSLGFKRVILPASSYQQTYFLRGIEQMPVANLMELMNLLKNGICPILPALPPQASIELPAFSALKILCSRETELRVLAIAAAGRHHLLFDGPPGSGKTTLMKHYPLLLPPLSETEAVEVYQIRSLVEAVNYQPASKPPCRAPHHSLSDIALVGGGKDPLPGEISLAHRGVLLLDEICEFSKYGLEALRQPLVDKQINIARANYKVSFPADFQLLATRNPCPCGWAGDANHQCRCITPTIKAYQNKLSGPLLDRIDLKYRVENLLVTQPQKTNSPERLVAKLTRLREQIAAVRKLQAKRKRNTSGALTGEQLPSYFSFNSQAVSELTALRSRQQLTLRGLGKLAHLSRTIADLDNKAEVDPEALYEAYDLNSY